MKLLIIGGTGILSTAVVDEAIRQGIEVTMINRGNRTLFINPKAELVVGDIRKNPEQISAKLNGRHFDAVIDFLIWNKEQLNLSLSLFGNIADQYVFISSAQVYNTSLKQIFTEESPMVQPLWGYSVKKYEAEQHLICYCNEKKIKYTIIRPGVNYGNTRIPYGMFPIIGKHWTMVERIKHRKPIITWNDGENRLNLTRVEDFASGTVGLIGNEQAINECFNVVGDNIYSWGEVLDVLGELIGVEPVKIDIPVLLYANYLKGDQKESLMGGRSKDLVCSNIKLKKAVPSFVTKYNLKEGLKLTLDFYRNNNYYNGFDYLYEGLHDRIIQQYMINMKQRDNYKIGFVSYSEQGLIEKCKSMKTYYTAFYSDSFIMRFLKRMK